MSNDTEAMKAAILEIEEMIKPYVSTIKAIQDDLKSVCIRRCNHLIRSPEGNLFLCPEIKNGQTTGEHELVTNPLEATAFTRQDAIMIAKSARNGHGFFEAVGEHQAKQDKAQQYLRLIAFYGGKVAKYRKQISEAHA